MNYRVAGIRGIVFVQRVTSVSALELGRFMSEHSLYDTSIGKLNHPDKN